MVGRAKWGLALGIGLPVVVLAVGAVVLSSWFRQQNVTNTSTDVHAEYAALYDEAWRADDGTGEATMTATLLTPRLQTLLRADPQRNLTDDQIERATRDIPTADIPLVVTLDAVAGSPAATISDAHISAALALQAANQSFTWQTLVPVTTPDKNTNTTANTVRRMWLAFFRAPVAVEWNSLRDLQLTVTNISDVAKRYFTWPQPALFNIDSAATD